MKKEDAPVEEKKEVAPVEEVAEESEEEVGFTLDDYLQEKQDKSKGLLAQKQTREHEKMDQKNIK